VPWTAESLFRYLRTGVEEQHAVASGPMAPVVHHLAGVQESEVRAIAVYVASIMGEPDAERRKRGEEAVAVAQSAAEAIGQYVPEPRQDTSRDATLQNGAALYAGSCAVCHNAAERPPGSPTSAALHLSLSTAVGLRTPDNLVRIILQGMAPPDGERGPFMPGFYGAFTDAQIASIAQYLRATYTDRPEWRNVERAVRTNRRSLAQE
jgi:mono/diheme cytochrome c family protein